MSEPFMDRWTLNGVEVLLQDHGRDQANGVPILDEDAKLPDRYFPAGYSDNIRVAPNYTEKVDVWLSKLAAGEWLPSNPIPTIDSGKGFLQERLFVTHTGAVVGANFNYNGVIRSADKGRNWTVVDSDIRTSSSSNPYCFFEVDNVVFMLGRSTNTLYRSTNDGVTWTISVIDPTIIGLLPSRHGRYVYYYEGALYVFARYTQSTGKVFKSTDLGMTWTPCSPELSTSHVFNDYSSFAVFNGKFFVGIAWGSSGNFSCERSSVDMDGTTWSTVSGTSAEVGNVLLSNGRILMSAATYDNATNKAYHWSADGTTFTEAQSPFTAGGWLRMDESTGTFYGCTSHLLRFDEVNHTWVDVDSSWIQSRCDFTRYYSLLFATTMDQSSSSASVIIKYSKDNGNSWSSLTVAEQVGGMQCSEKDNVAYLTIKHGENNYIFFGYNDLVPLFLE